MSAPWSVPRGVAIAVGLLLAARPAQSEGTTVLLPTSRARIFAKPSGEVWSVVRRLAKDLDLAVDRDDTHQLFAMWWQPFLRSETGGFKILPRRTEGPTAALKLQIHVFVSPFAEPAHVYVDSIVSENTREGLLLTYGSEEVSGWFFSQLEARLAERGRPMPTDPAERAWLAAKLGGPPPCEALLRPETTEAGPEARPRTISRPEPIYPRKDREQRREAVITVEAALAEDGAVHSTVAKAGPDQAEMARAAEAAVTLGRYEPARAGGCAVPSVMEVLVRFKLR